MKIMKQKHEYPPLQNTTGNLPSIDTLPARIRVIATLRGLGYSFREIGQQLSVTPQAVSLMLKRHLRSLESIDGSVDMARLSARAVNALGRHGIRSREDARRTNILPLLRYERNCGSKTYEEIERWLNESEPTPPGKRQNSKDRSLGKHPAC
jgi:DNA-directed RNA polymerase alpha subunit